MIRSFGRRFEWQRCLFVFGLLLLGRAAIHAQGGGGFDMLSSVIAGGGGASSGDIFTLNGTIGQSIAGNVSGGTFSVAAGSIPAASDPLPKWATFAAWQNAYFTPQQLSDPNISGSSADPNGDGLNNLLEYAFHADPNGFTSSPRPYSMLDPNYLSLVYTRSLGATDLTFSVEQSTDLAGAWSPAAPLNQILFDNGFVQIIQAEVPRTNAGISGKLFLRLHVTKP